MASTNKTTHYDLSQYVATDKPTYLVDYNGDMNKIDTAIYGADSLSRVNESAIGDLTELTTTAKNNLVSALNEVNTQVGTNTGNIATNTSNIASNTGAIGVLANLTTTAKNNLVSATNEVNSKVDTVATDLNSLAQVLNLTDITHFTTGTISSGTLNGVDITVATNSDKSICKIYGNFSRTGGSGATLTLDTNFNVDEEFTVGYSGYVLDSNTYGVSGATRITFKTNGKIELYSGSANQVIAFFNPFVIFVKNFGDTPTP